MSEKSSFSQKVESFLGGKGFYIVLAVCIAVIGVSAWVIFSAQESETEEDYAVIMPDMNEILDIPVVTAPLPDVETSAPAESWEEAVPTLNPVEVPLEEETAPEPEAVKPEKSAAREEKVPEAEPEEKAAPSTEELVFIWPVSGEIAVPYSPASLLFDKTMGDWRTHNGIDIEAAVGTKVMAVASGTVQSVESDDMYGTVVRIDHGEGLVSVYANLAGTPTVKAGDAVTMSSVIGSVGDTALAETGEVAHLHFAMEKDGASIDPADYLPRR